MYIKVPNDTKKQQKVPERQALHSTGTISYYYPNLPKFNIQAGIQTHCIY